MPQEGRTATIMLFGNARECEVAQVLPQSSVFCPCRRCQRTARELPRACKHWGPGKDLEHLLTTGACLNMCMAPGHYLGSRAAMQPAWIGSSDTSMLQQSVACLAGHD